MVHLCGLDVQGFIWINGVWKFTSTLVIWARLSTRSLCMWSSKHSTQFNCLHKKVISPRNPSCMSFNMANHTKWSIQCNHTFTLATALVIQHTPIFTLIHSLYTLWLKQKYSFRQWNLKALNSKAKIVKWVIKSCLAQPWYTSRPNSPPNFLDSDKFRWASQEGTQKNELKKAHVIFICLYPYLFFVCTQMHTSHFAPDSC